MPLRQDDIESICRPKNCKVCVLFEHTWLCDPKGTSGTRANEAKRTVYRPLSRTNSYTVCDSSHATSGSP